MELISEKKGRCASSSQVLVGMTVHRTVSLNLIRHANPFLKYKDVHGPPVENQWTTQFVRRGGPAV